MKSIGLFYGSSLDNTKDAGTLLKRELEALTDVKIDMYDVAKAKLSARWHGAARSWHNQPTLYQQ